MSSQITREYYTEEEAKNKRCPYYNNCIGSSCMLWTWQYLQTSSKYLNIENPAPYYVKTNKGCCGL